MYFYSFMQFLQAFHRSRSGATIVLFALMVLPLVAMAGMVLDFGMARNERADLIALRWYIASPLPGRRTLHDRKAVSAGKPLRR